MLDLAEYESGVGPCGMHHDWTMDPNNDARLTFEKERCPACASWDQYRRFIADDDRKRMDGKDPKPGMPQPGDGRIVRMRPMSPAEIELSRRP